MIVDILLVIAGWFIQLIAYILPTWTLWPADVLAGLNYFCGSLAKLNFLFPVDTLFTCILFFINFEVLYFGAKILMKLFNFIRGTGSGIDI